MSCEDEECHCNACETCFHCGNKLGTENNGCRHCIGLVMEV